MAILSLENVVKAYHQKVAVNDVSFQMPEGTIFGMLGPNGAGKTSLIRIITTITQADSGKVFFDNQPISPKSAEQIGYMPEERGLYKKMKVGEHLVYLAQLRGIKESQAKAITKQWLEKFEITDWYNKRIDELSKGMSQKVQFIATVLHQPKLLILDEPFSGLDPVNANLIKDEIYNLHKNGTSIIFSTHRMEQVEEICDNIVLINQGKNVLEGDVHKIKQQYKENMFEVDFSGELPGSVYEKYDIISTQEHSVRFRLKEQSSNELLRMLLDNNIVIKKFQEALPSLNDIFIKKVQEENC